MLLKNKISIVSGVGNRFGKAVAYLFAREGAKIILISRDSKVINEIVLNIKKDGGDALGIVCDVTDSECVKKAFEEIIGKYGRIDILLNSVGGSYTKRQTLKYMDEEFWDMVIKNNLKSIFLVSKNFITYASKNGGSIINISCAYKTLLDGNLAYAAAKSGIVGLTKNLAKELRDDNIRVNCIMPGVIRNNFNIKNLDNPPNIINRKGNSEDVAHAALYFASDHSSWITGQTLVVDGGEELFLEMEKTE